MQCHFTIFLLLHVFSIGWDCVESTAERITLAAVSECEPWAERRDNADTDIGGKIHCYMICVTILLSDRGTPIVKDKTSAL